MEQTISRRGPCTNKPQTNPWFNFFLAGMILRRNRLFQCACRSNSEEMWVRFRESRNKVTSAIGSTKRRYYMHKAALLMKQDCNCPSAKWWKAAKKLTGQTVDVKGVPPLQDTKGSFVYGEKGKAALLNGMFINQCATVSDSHAPFWTDSYQHHLQLSVCPHDRHYKNHTKSSKQTLLGT